MTDWPGTQNTASRVVTLLDAPGERCYGRAFLVEPEVFEHLDDREINGYERYRIEICFDDERATGVVYRAPVNNFAFLGEAPLDLELWEMAWRVSWNPSADTSTVYRPGGRGIPGS